MPEGAAARDAARRPDLASSPATARSSRCTAARTSRRRSSTPPPRPRCRPGSTFKIFTLIAALQDQRSAPRPSSTAAARSTSRSSRTPPPRTTVQRRARSSNFGRRAVRATSTCARRPATRSTPSSRSSTSRSARRTTKEAAVAAGLPAKGLERRTTPTSSAPTRHGARHGQRLRHHRRPGRAGHPVPHQERQGRPRRPQLQGQAVKKAGLRQGRHGRHHRRHDGAGQGRHRPSSPRTSAGRPRARPAPPTDNKSAWFDGYVPQLATAVGIYSSGKNGDELSMDNLPGVGELTGGTVPVRIWTDYMKAALEGPEGPGVP